MVYTFFIVILETNKRLKLFYNFWDRPLIDEFWLCYIIFYPN